ncbi:MAG: DsbA family protein [Alphaproteobacteria bacterium]|nr:DsbA family protein [Alphaproteobacteria bacterium]
MTAATAITSRIAAWITSETRLNLARTREEISRRLQRKGRDILYFHRTDDPYCQLMVQALPDLIARFDITVRPLVVERLPAIMYPDPARYEAYSILDATRLARLYGLGFPSSAMVPDRLSVGMANRYLVSLQDDPSFFGVAEEVGEALWRNDYKTVRTLCVAADIDESTLEENEKLLRGLGHYASGTVFYGGEFYLGLDRLDHLERRLNAARIGDDEVHFELTRLWRYGLNSMEKSLSGRQVELFFSVRSPYSYLGLQLASELVDKTGVRLKLKPVLPMMMRGMKVPPTKARYILLDTAREARAEKIPFGRIVDPLGSATERAMALGFALAEGGDDLAFFKAFTRGVWAEGIDGASEKGMATILDRSGLGASCAKEALDDAIWRPMAEKNQQMLFMAGAWGVPTFRVGAETLWGQDRLWAVVDTLKQE